MMKVIQRVNFAGQILSQLSFQSQMTIRPQKPAKCLKVIHTGTNIGFLWPLVVMVTLQASALMSLSLHLKCKSAEHWVQWYTLQRLTLSYTCWWGPKAKTAVQGTLSCDPTEDVIFFSQTLSLALHSTTEFFFFLQPFYCTRRFGPETRAFFGGGCHFFIFFDCTQSNRQNAISLTIPLIRDYTRPSTLLLLTNNKQTHSSSARQVHFQTKSVIRCDAVSVSYL